MRPTYPNKPAGFSLLEMILAVALLALLTGLLIQIGLAGARYYRKSITTVALQQACLMTANQVGREIQQTTLGSILEDTTPAKEFVTFASPRDASGAVKFSAGNLLLWQSFVCFYVDKIQDKQCLFRQISPITPPVDLVPSVPSGVNAAFFRALSAPNRPKLVGENIYYIDVIRAREVTVRVAALDPDMQIRISVATKVLPRN